MFLRFRLHKSPIHYGKGSNLSPRFVGPFEILERLGPLAYRLALPPSLSCIHDVFQVSVLRRYITDPYHVLDWTSLKVQDQGQVTVEPIHIIDHKTLGL